MDTCLVATVSEGGREGGREKEREGERKQHTIYNTYYMSQSGIWRVISRVGCIFTSRRRVKIQPKSEMTHHIPRMTSVINGLFYI